MEIFARSGEVGSFQYRIEVHCFYVVKVMEPSDELMIFLIYREGGLRIFIGFGISWHLDVK